MADYYQLEDGSGNYQLEDGSGAYLLAISSTKWRILVNNVQGGISHTNVAIAEMEMRVSAGGADQCTGGTATASGNIGSGFEADKAFDDNSTTMWNSGTPIGSWLQYEFASAKDIVEYTVQARASFLNDCPVCWRLQYWDGSAWQSTHLVLGEPNWSASETRTYTPSGAKFGWWIQIDNLQGGLGHGNVAIAEMQMRITNGGADQCTGGVASGFGTIGGGTEPDKAFDDNSTTMWNCGNPIGASLKYEFGSAKDIIEYTIQARATNLDDCPVAWQIIRFDGTGFVTEHTVTGEPNWSASETRTYSLLSRQPLMFIIT